MTKPSTRAEVLRAVRRAPAPLSTADIAAAVGKCTAVVREHLNALEGSGRVRRTTLTGLRGNSTRWAPALESPGRDAVMDFLDRLEAAPTPDRPGIKATRRLIACLEERLTIAQGAQPLFDLQGAVE